MTHPLLPFVRCFAFAGRARRTEVWQCVTIAGAALAAGAGWDMHIGQATAIAGVAGPLTTVLALLLVLPLAAVTVRRLHDIDRSGLWAALAVVPVVGTAWLAALFLTPGARGANRFGVDPKGPERRPAMGGH